MTLSGKFDSRQADASVDRAGIRRYEGRMMQATPFHEAMIATAMDGAAPWANLEQIVIRAPDLHPDAETIRRAATELAQRHTALRLRAEIGAVGSALWHLADHVLPDVAPLPDGITTPETLAAWLGQDREAGVDLRQHGWRLRYHQDVQGLLLIFTAHHALLDLPSMAVLMQDLTGLLTAQPTDPAPVGDLAAFVTSLWQRDTVAAQQHFADRFAEFDAGTPLTAGTARPGRMQVLTRLLNQHDTTALRDLAVQSGGTLFAALQAAWALLLARWSGRDEGAFGLTLAGRRLFPGHETTVGALIATLPQRLHLADLPDLRSLIARAQVETAALRPHHATALREVREWAGLAASVPLFDSVLVYSPQRLDALLRSRDPTWTTREVRLLEEGDVPLTLAIYGQDRLEIEVEFDPTQIDPAKAERIADHYLRLLGAMAQARPEAGLGTLGMLDAEEITQLRHLGQPNLPLGEQVPCPVTRFEAQARATPDAVAVQDSDGSLLTFAQLDRQANALAWRLIAQGAGLGQIVAINLPRCADFIVSALAVLKTGGAFLPLDTALPETERCLRAVEAGVSAIIGQNGLAGLAVPLLRPDRAERHDTLPRPPMRADRLAYIIHTSGSTGRPKGVMGTTGALSAHASAMIALFDLGTADRVLHFASPGFDVALEEIVPSLLAGASVVIRGEDEITSVQAFLDFLRDRQVTVMNLPASFWHVLVEEMVARGLSLPPSIRLTVTGSERITASALAQWQRLAPQCRWMNGYGPTETTITCTAYAPDLTAGPVDERQDVPIGRPLGHATAQVLAFDRTLSPLGAEGSLFIGGPAVTLGYLNQPAITARSFLPDPLAAQAGGHRYATGDRALWRADGQLCFLGRRDRQVKLRGHRLDLGDVERTLAQFEGVRDVRVAVENPGSDQARLLAWVCGPDLAAGSPALAALVEHVSRYMTGATMPMILPVPAFPLRPNGKVDMAALPRPGTATGETAANAPLDSFAFAVQRCMIEVLAQPDLGPDDDIRDHGANSLMALRLASVIEARFGRDIVTTDLYRYPTARSLARFLESEDEEAHLIVPIQAGGGQVPFFAVHVLGEKESLFRPLAEALGPDYPVYGLTVGPPKDLEDISVSRIARRYFADIQRAFPEGPIGLGAVSMAAYFAFELAQMLRAAGREVRVLAVLDAMGPGGRPSLSGKGKLVAHLHELRRHRLHHLRRVLRFKLENRQIARELAEAAPGEVNGANLVEANVRAVEDYQPRAYGGPITVFRAADSFWDSPEAIASGLGWRPVATGGLELIDVPGDHLSILAPDNARHLARHLAARLRRD